MSELDRNTGWRPASDHGLPDGTMVEVRIPSGVRWLRYIAAPSTVEWIADKDAQVYDTAGLSEDIPLAEVRPLVPASEAEEWVPLTAEQVKHVEQGTTVRVEGDGMAITGPFDRIKSYESDVRVFLMSRGGQTWCVQGTVSVSPEVAARVIERADPAREAVSTIIEGYNARVPLDEFFIRLRAAGFDVVPKEDR